ncbi:MAG: Ig-like domain-containing protein [Nitrososphaeraceae archaeon]
MVYMGLVMFFLFTTIIVYSSVSNIYGFITSANGDLDLDFVLTNNFESYNHYSLMKSVPISLDKQLAETADKQLAETADKQLDETDEQLAEPVDEQQQQNDAGKDSDDDAGKDSDDDAGKQQIPQQGQPQPEGLQSQNQELPANAPQILLGPVNTPPTAIDNPDIITTEKDKPIEITLAGSDADPGDELTAEIDKTPLNGNLSTINQTTGKLTYIPNPNFVGQDVFTFKVKDKQGQNSSNVGTVKINVQ